MRQHRDHTVYQIYGGSAFQCLHVQCAVLLHIIGHVCDMHAKLIVLAFPRQRDRIVQVLRIFAVNGNGLPVTQIHPACHIRSRNLIGNIFDLF